jgi:hypothetical protein
MSRAAPLVLFVLALGCTGQPARDRTWEAHAAALKGRWVVRFTYSSGESADGTMELMPNRTIDRRFPRIGVPTSYGTYAVVFPKLGGPPSGSRVPAIVAGFVPGSDSVIVSFETDRETFWMQMLGVHAGDSVQGKWVAGQSRGTIASGSFIMARP